MVEAPLLRTLRYHDAKGDTRRIHQNDLLTLPLPLVVLGEPGVGKSVLLAAIAEQHGLTLMTAKQLLRHHSIEPGNVLAIDALDELAVANETDAVQSVLERLDRLGRPPFILSCRAAEWQGAVAALDIKTDYGRDPIVLTLEPFDRDDASAYLAQNISTDRVVQLLEHLEERSLESLYTNPLTLRLLADLELRHAKLPDNRGDLFALACDLLWSEQALAHDGSKLAQLTRNTALLAAGAVAAVHVLTSADAISTRGVGRLEEDQPISAVEELPHGEVARTVLASRLFIPVDTQRFAPLHRVIAEFLGARWLAQLITDGVPLERILAFLTLNETVPASLRGIHAWLAFFSDAAAARVIDADPYGVLRYGDASTLTTVRLRRLLGALGRLAEVDPYFRANDWGGRPAHALARTDLGPEIVAVLQTSENFHLRKLLLEAIAGTALAAELALPLREILFDERAAYAERFDAGEALRPVLPSTEWPGIIRWLRERPTDDNGRLAVDLLARSDPADFADEEFAQTIGAFLGYTVAPVGGSAEPARRPIGTMSGLARRLPDARLAGVLDALCDYIPIAAQDDDWERRWELAYFAARGIRHSLQYAPAEPARVWRWLSLMDDRHGRGRDDHKKLEAYVAGEPSLRHALQRYALFERSPEKSLWMRSWRLSDTLAGLSVTPADAETYLEEFAQNSSPDEQEREEWRDLVTLARTADGLTPAALAAARRFAKGNREAQSFLRKVLNPPANTWEKREAAKQARRDSDREKRWTKHRADFVAQRDALRAGELRWIVPPARAYLNLFHDTDRQQAPMERLNDWLGSDLADDACAGFDAALFRSDLPTPAEVAQSYVGNQRWNMVYSLVAAFAERRRKGIALDDIPAAALQLVWLALHHESYLEEHAALENALDAIETQWGDVGPTLIANYRLLLEPQLAAGQAHPTGLYRLMREKALGGIAGVLAAEWLGRFPDLPPITQLELVDHLLDAGAWQILRDLWQGRLAGSPAAAEPGAVPEPQGDPVPEPDPEAEAGRQEDDARERRLLWLAIGFITDFNRALPLLEAEGAANPRLLWALRNRLRRGDRSGNFHDAAPGQLGWLVASFRSAWPWRSRPNTVTTGDHNAWDATDFLRAIVNELARDLSAEAGAVMIALRDAPVDAYSDLIRHAAAQQRRARDEAAYQPLSATELRAVARNELPQSIDDLQAVLLETLRRLQAELRASETNPLDAFYVAPGEPRTENYCRDRIVEWLRRSVPSGVTLSTETRMPADKRSDIAFVAGEALVPVEIKPQWNPKLWDAAIDQLDAFYTSEWRARGRGIYLVLWFGPVTAPRRALTPPPEDEAAPTSATALARQLEARIPEARRGQLSVVVLDLSR